MKRDAKAELANIRELKRLSVRLARAENLLAVAHLCACDPCRNRIERFIPRLKGQEVSESGEDS